MVAPLLVPSSHLRNQSASRDSSCRSGGLLQVAWAVRQERNAPARAFPSLRKLAQPARGARPRLRCSVAVGWCNATMPPLVSHPCVGDATNVSCITREGSCVTETLGCVTGTSACVIQTLVAVTHAEVPVTQSKGPVMHAVGRMTHAEVPVTHAEVAVPQPKVPVTHAMVAGTHAE